MNSTQTHSGKHYRDRFGIQFIPSYVLIRPDGTYERIENVHKASELLRILHEAQPQQ